MTSENLARIINNMVPNLCYVKDGISGAPRKGFKHTVTLNGIEYSFYSTRNITPNLRRFLDEVQDRSSDYCGGMPFTYGDFEEEYVERELTFFWLKNAQNFLLDKSEWGEIITFVHELAGRTYENLSISKNLIINPNSTGCVDLRSLSEKKILDILATTNYTFVEVDELLRLIRYDCIEISDINAKTTYSDIPDFILPYSQYLSQVEGGIGITLLRTGDILLYSSSCLLATMRKNHWTIYDNAPIKNTLVDLLGIHLYGLACNLYDIIWNVSYRRHGALIIVADSPAYVHIVNKESILSGSETSDLRNAILNDVNGIDIATTGQIKKKSLLLELCSIDGAVVIGPRGTVDAFGSIIESHPDAGKASGARTTAARSAIRHGNMIPIKVSSDGDITMYGSFTDDDGVKYVEFTFY